MAERKESHPYIKKLDKARHPLLTVRAHMPGFQPDGSELHIDISGMELQLRDSMPNPLLRPNFASRLSIHNPGDDFPITAYGEGSTYATKVLGVDADLLADAKVRVAGTNIYVDPEKNFDDLYPQHLEFYRNLFEARQDIIMPILSSDDLVVSLGSKPRKTGAILTLEGIYHTERTQRPEQLVVDLSNDGIRSIMPVHNDDNDLATGHKTTEEYGLTPLGQRFVREAMRRGRTIDLSHASSQTAWDVIDAYDEIFIENPDCPPPIISHTGSRDRVGLTRNTEDKIAIQIAKRGGIIGVMPAKWIVETEENEGKASVKSVVDLIEHYLEIFSNAGIKDADKRIAIGTDFDGMGLESIIPGLEHIQKVGPALYLEMLKRKIPHEVIGNILSKNATDYYLQHLPKQNDLMQAA